MFQNISEKRTGQFNVSVWNQIPLFVVGIHRLCFPVASLVVRLFPFFTLPNCQGLKDTEEHRMGSLELQSIAAYHLQQGTIYLCCHTILWGGTKNQTLQSRAREC